MTILINGSASILHPLENFHLAGNIQLLQHFFRLFLWVFRGRVENGRSQRSIGSMLFQPGLKPGGFGFLVQPKLADCVFFWGGSLLGISGLLGYSLLKTSEPF